MLEEVDGAVLVGLLCMLVAVLEKKRHYGVDDEEINKLGTHPFGLPRRRGIKTVMVVPIGGSCEVEELLEIGGALGFEQSAEKTVGTADKLCKLADAQGGETVRPQSGETPQMGRDRGKPGSSSKGSVVGLELTGVVIFKIAFQKTRLTHEKSLDALGLVPPTGKEGLWS